MFFMEYISYVFIEENNDNEFIYFIEDLFLSFFFFNSFLLLL